MGKGVHQRFQLPLRQIDIIENYGNMLWIARCYARQHLGIRIAGILKRWTEKLRLQMWMSA
jgi:hypothetical protein